MILAELKVLKLIFDFEETFEDPLSRSKSIIKLPQGNNQMRLSEVDSSTSSMLPSTIASYF